LGHLGALILAILAMVQVVEFTLYLKRRRDVPDRFNLNPQSKPRSWSDEGGLDG
jgi:hypothetical protein